MGRGYIVRIPDNVDLIEYLKLIGEQESQGIKWGNCFKDALLNRMENGTNKTGDLLPWPKTHDHVQLRPGELSIWAGTNGHKKSMLLGMIMLWVSRKSPVCIASFEMQPESTLMRMCFQAAGCIPSQAYGAKFADWCENHICIYDELDTVQAERVLGMVYYASKELGCKHIVIDSLTKCGLGTDDYNAQKGFVDRLAWAAKTLKVHIHLVCHMRKGQDEYAMPGKFDVRGASEITDLADNVFVVWKNKKYEELWKMQLAGVALDAKALEFLEKQAPQMLCVEKQRHGEWEGKFRLGFCDKSLQFTSNQDQRPIPFAPVR